MSEPDPGRTVPRRILLDVDDTILLPHPADAPDAVRAAGLPAGMAVIDAPFPCGEGTFVACYRPAAIAALRRAHNAGVEVIWSTSWLAGDPAALDDLAALIGAGFVRRPTPDELPVAPNRSGIDGSSRIWAAGHWKLRAWGHHLDHAETVIIDDQVAFAAFVLRTAPRRYAGGWIRPRSGRGFQPADAAALTRWIHRGILPATPSRPW